MKLVFVISRMQYGGAERVMANLANYCVSKGVHVILTTAYHCESVYQLDSKISLRVLHHHESGKNPFSRAFGAIMDLYLLLKKEKPDAVISFLTDINILAIPAARIANIPIIVSERNDPERNPTNKVKRIGRYLLYGLSNGFVFQTPEAQRYFTISIQKRSKVIPNPLLSEYIPKYFTGKRELRFVNVGRLEEQKNHLILIRAFTRIVKNHHDARLYIYGEGSLHRKLQLEIEANHMENNIILKGTKDNILEEINDAYAFVLSSNYEGISNALLEAMACGLAVISTDCPCGGSRMLIDNRRNGILVKVLSENDLYIAMEKLISNSKLATKMGKKALYVRKKYSPQKINEIWVNYIENIVAYGGKGR